MQKFGGSTPFNCQFRPESSGEGILPSVASVKTDALILKARRIEARNLTDKEICTIAEILEKRWLKMEPNGSFEKYVKELEWIRKNGHTPIWVAEIDGVIGAALIAQRVNEIPAKYADLIGVDEPCGNTMICRRITTDPDDPRFAKAPRMLIAQDAFAYAKEFHGKGALRELFAYSRFANYGEFVERFGKIEPKSYLRTTYQKDWTVEDLWGMQRAYDSWVLERIGDVKTDIGSFLRARERKHIDGTIGMHLSFGASPHKILPGSCPDDAQARGYAVLMSYTHLLEGTDPMDRALMLV